MTKNIPWLVIMCLMPLMLMSQTENWVYRYNHPGINEYLSSIVYGDDGNLYAAGCITDTSVSPYKQDFLVLSLTPSGDTNWIYIYDGPYHLDDKATSITYGSDGNIYASGYRTVSAEGWRELIALSLSNDGTHRWTYAHDQGGYWDGFNSIVYGSDGNIYAAGGCGSQQVFIVVSLSNNGLERWDYWYYGSNNGDIARSIVYGADGNLYAAGYTSDDVTNQDFTVISLDTTGLERWIYTFDGAGSLDQANAIVYGSDGNLYAAGFIGNPAPTYRDFAVISLTNTGTERWVYSYDGPGYGSDEAKSIVYGLDGNVYAAGYGGGVNWDKDMAVVGLTNTGVEQWVYTYDHPENEDDYVNAIAYGTRHNIYAAGCTGDASKFITTCLTNSGDSSWVYRQGGNNSYGSAYALVYGPDSNLYVAGNTYNSSSDPYDITVVSLSTNDDEVAPSAPSLAFPMNDSYISDSMITFVWHPAYDSGSGVMEYTLQIALDTSFVASVELSTQDTAYAYTLSDTTYYWRVNATDHANNTGEWSSVWNFSIDTQSPNAPVLVYPIDGADLGDTIVTFEWTQVIFNSSSFDTEKSMAGVRTAPVRYVFQLDTLDSFISPIVTDTFDVTNATLMCPEDYYYWHIRAYDLAGNESSYSNYNTFGVDVTPPSIESTTVWTDTSYAGPFPVYAKITDVSGVDSVFLYFKRMEDPSWVATSMTADVNNWYYAEIPQAYISDDTVKYYVEATDIAEPQNISTDPPGAPVYHYTFIANSTGVEENNVKLPQVYYLGPNTPNPFKKSTTIHFAIPEETQVSCRIYNAAGQCVHTLFNGVYKVGYYNESWNAYDNVGKKLPAGVYLCVLESSNYKKTIKMILLD